MMFMFRCRARINLVAKFAGLIASAVAAALLLSGCAAYRPTGAWGIYAENAFLNSCELRARVAYCSCMLGFLEQRESIEQASSGIYPADFQTGVNTCQWAFL